jgi:hypothetical protein
MRKKWSGVYLHGFGLGMIILNLAERRIRQGCNGDATGQASHAAANIAIYLSVV